MEEGEAKAVEEAGEPTTEKEVEMRAGYLNAVVVG